MSTWQASDLLHNCLLAVGNNFLVTRNGIKRKHNLPAGRLKEGTVGQRRYFFERKELFEPWQR
jgi:hypothetical protein